MGSRPGVWVFSAVSFGVAGSLSPAHPMDITLEDSSVEEDSPVRGNEVRILAQGKSRAYITSATELLQGDGEPTVVLTANGRAINKAVVVCEIVRRRILGLHQVTEISSVDVTDAAAAAQEVSSEAAPPQMRRVSMVSITLSLEPLDTRLPGYQAPLHESLVQPWEEASTHDPEAAPSSPPNLSYQSSGSQPSTSTAAPSSSSAPPSPGRVPRGGPGAGGGRGRGRGGPSQYGGGRHGQRSWGQRA